MSEDTSHEDQPARETEPADDAEGSRHTEPGEDAAGWKAASEAGKDDSDDQGS